MSTASPTAFLLWAILSVLFLAFLVHHLWCYDKFKCLRWSAGRQPGAFKRVMTYSYLGAVPLFAVYSIGTTVIKYREGFFYTPDGKFLPMPVELYKEPNRAWVLPLQFVFSFAWALEQVTHLEELAFWLYLLHQNPNKEAWFSSWEYRLWYMGSLVALIGLPLTAVVTRNHLETVDAYIFLVGAAGSTSTTISFLYVLWRFPRFIRHVKSEGAEPTVVVRLATFYQLNQVRVVFRFMFTLPLLVVALDGIIGTTHYVNRNLFLTDFFQMIAGLGCFFSSMITLLIFFPRSIVREAGYKPKLSSTLPTSPKSPPVTPPSRSAPFPPPMNLHQHHPSMQMYMGAGAYGGAPGRYTTTETGITGVASWEMDESAYSASMYSPRESLYEDSPQYTEEARSDGGGHYQRRLSRRSSRRVGAWQHQPMDAHRERDTDTEADDEREYVPVDEESVPPYSHAHPHPHPPPPQSQPAPAQQLHQRQPFPHSVSSPQILVVSQVQSQPQPQPMSPHAPPPSPPPPPPAATAARPPSPSRKRRTWGWEEARHASFALGGVAMLSSNAPPNGNLAQHANTNTGANGNVNAGGDGSAVRRSLHIVATGPDGTAVGVGPNGVGVGVGVGVGLGLLGRAGRRVSNLHPYVVNFTSPIDLVDIPPLDELPHAL
ncbi:hypothetical protein GY45DRAFT_1338468 [Cubamyces sp. BRFM 1775]|nr:hypothetical protein GY45DRAFT_1338468 [Cubamyces sp. BRFM 1775]